MFSLFGAEVKTKQLVLAGAALVLLIVLDRLVNGTRLGQGIRAVAQDAETASLMGVDINRVITQTFVIGGLLGGAAGFLYGSAFDVQNTMGFIPGVKAFTAAVLGGIGNVRGAVLGGVLLGLVENYGVACANSAYRDVIAFSILVLVLLVRPVRHPRRAPGAVRMTRHADARSAATPGAPVAAARHRPRGRPAPRRAWSAARPSACSPRSSPARAAPATSPTARPRAARCCTRGSMPYLLAGLALGGLFLLARPRPAVGARAAARWLRHRAAPP